MLLDRQTNGANRTYFQNDSDQAVASAFQEVHLAVAFDAPAEDFVHPAGICCARLA